MHGARATLFTIAATLVCLAGALRVEGAEVAGDGPEAEPSIEEMIAAIQAARGGGGAAATGGGGAARPASRPGGAPRPVATAPRTASRRAPVSPPRPPPNVVQVVGAELKAIKARGKLRDGFYRKHMKFYNLADLYMKFGSYKKAALVIAEMRRKQVYNAAKSPVPNAARLGEWSAFRTIDSYKDAEGRGEMMLSRALTCLGNAAGAEKALADAGAKGAAKPMGEWRRKVYREALARTAGFSRGYPAAKEELDRLTASLGKGGDEAPSAGTQWAIVEISDPGGGRAGNALRWIEGLLVMLAKYPGHKAVTSGHARWMLFQAYRMFEMHEKCVELLDEIRERHPELRVSWARRGATSQDVIWQKAESYVRLGLLQDEHKDPRALGSYRKAVETFELFRKTWPDHRSNHPTEWSRVSLMQQRLGVVQEAIGRLSR